MTGDLRFEAPLYSLAQAARLLGVPPTTFAGWGKGYVRRFPDRPTVEGAPLLSLFESPRGPTVPFIALAEGMALAAIRNTGIPMQRIRPALAVLDRELGISHALASNRLYSDGAEVLFDFGTRHPESAEAARHLVVVRSGQRVFNDVVAGYLERIQFAADGYAELLHLPDYRRRQVIVDPTRSFGQPIFTAGAARVSDVFDRFHAGESLADLADDFGVPREDLSAGLSGLLW